MIIDTWQADILLSVIGSTSRYLTAHICYANSLHVIPKKASNKGLGLSSARTRVESISFKPDYIFSVV